jgi:hypothetical protein
MRCTVQKGAPAAHHAEPDAAAALVPASFDAIRVPSLFAPKRALDLLFSMAAHIATTRQMGGTEPRAIGHLNQLHRAARPPSPQRARRWP